MKFVGMVVSVVIDATELFKSEAFKRWVEAPQCKVNTPFAEHYSREYPLVGHSEVVVMLDPTLNGQGNGEDRMPGWDEILAAVKANITPRLGSELPILVRLVNRGDHDRA